MISDWEDGMLSEIKTRHEVSVLTFSCNCCSYNHKSVRDVFFFNQVRKKDLQNEVIRLSLEHNIVTQFTSFVAVEKREKVRESFRCDVILLN